MNVELEVWGALFWSKVHFLKMLKLEIDGWDSILSLYDKAGHLYG